MPNWKKVIVSGSSASLTSVTATTGFTGSLSGSASTSTSASFASTASFVNTLNQNVLITGSLTVGATTAGANENTLILGPAPAGGTGEGGQLLLQAPGGTYTSASMLDNWQNYTRLLRGTNASSDAVVAQFNMHSKQVIFPQYNSPTAFTGTTLVGLLGFDSSGNLLTTTTSSGGGGGGVTITNNVDNYVITATGIANTINGESNMQFNGSSLTITGEITSSGAIRSTANNSMYFRGGDDAEFWDINVANTVGIYGQQTQTVAGLKLGSAGATLYGSGSRFGIGTTSPVATLDVNGNLFVASGITGSLQGTASYATQALSASWAPGSGVTINNNTNNYLVTATGTTNTLNGEATLQFDGSTLAVDYAKITLKEVVNDYTQSIQLQPDDAYLSIGQADPMKAVLQVSDFGTNPQVKIGAGNVLDVWNVGYNLGVSGSSIFKGNVNITGSFSTQTYDGANYVEAIVISDNKRTINDTLGTGSFDADQRNLQDSSNNTSINWDSRRAFDDFGVASIRWGVVRSTYDSVESQSIDWNNRMLKIDNGPGSFTVNWSSGLLRDTGSKNSVNWQDRIAIDNNLKDSINWQSRDLLDSSANASVNWNSRYLYRSGVAVVDWGNVNLNDIAGTASVDWNSRFMYDLSGNTSMNWSNRELLDSINTTVLNWDAYPLNYKIEAYTYFKKYISTQYQELFSDVPTIAFNYEGEAIGGVLDNNVALYDLVFLETDGIWYQNVQGTVDCSKLLGICVDTSPGKEIILLEGSLTVNDSGFIDSPSVQAIDHGLPIYIRDSAGTQMSTVIPSTPGDYARILGHAYYQNTNNPQYWVMKFKPSNDWIVI